MKTRIQIYVILGILAAVLLDYWTSAEPPNSSVETSNWLALSKVQHEKISAQKVIITAKSDSLRTFRRSFRSARATADSALAVHDTVRFVEYAQVALDTAEWITRVDSAATAAQMDAAALYDQALHSADSTIAVRDKRIRKLERSSWRDFVSVTAGVDLYGKPTLAVGVRVWPRPKR